MKKTTPADMPPMECLYLGKSAAAHVAGSAPAPSRHFALKRKPKSAALRVELLQKCKRLRTSNGSFMYYNCWTVVLSGHPASEAANNMRKTGSNSSLPVKFRSFAKKMDDKSENITWEFCRIFALAHVVYCIYLCSAHARNPEQGIR